MMTSADRNIFILMGSLLVNSSVSAEPVPELDCLIEPNKVIELSSPVSGVLDTIAVDRSDSVNKKQIVARLKSDVEQVKLKATQEKLAASRVIQQRAANLYRDHVITLSEKEEADHELAINEFEVENARANLELKNIRSPVDAVVVDRFLMPGEFIEDKPILKLAQLNPLRVEVVAPVAYFGRVKPGMHARVKTEFGSFENLVAEVVVVDKVIDAASGTFGIRLELENEDNQVPGGLKCTVRFLDEHEEAEYVKNGSDDNTSAVVAPPVTEPVITDQGNTDVEQNTICRRIGPFRKKDDLLALMNVLEDVISGYDIRDDITTTASYLVTTDPLESREAAESLVAEMKRAGMNDIAIMKHSSGFSIALGLFSNKKSAYKRLAKIKKHGYGCKVVPQTMNKTLYWAEVTADKSEDAISELVTASGLVDTNTLIYLSCNTEILASGSR